MTANDLEQYYCFKATKGDLTAYAKSYVIPQDLSGFGSRVTAVSGDYMVIGDREDDGHSGSNTGAVYIFKRNGVTWTLEQKIDDQETGFDNLERNDYFGHSVAISDETVAVGAYYDDGNGTNTGGYRHGAVYIFTRNSSGVWSLEDEISGTDHSDNTGFDSSSLNSNDYFGYSVALDGNTLAVGVYRDNSQRGGRLYLHQVG